MAGSAHVIPLAEAMQLGMRLDSAWRRSICISRRSRKFRIDWASRPAMAVAVKGPRYHLRADSAQRESVLVVAGNCRFRGFPHFIYGTVGAAQVVNLALGPLNGCPRIAALSFNGEAHRFLSVIAEAVSFPPTASTAAWWLHVQCCSKTALGRQVRGAAGST